MRTRLSFILLSLLLCGIAALPVDAVEVGEMAPDFSLTGTDGKVYSLSNYRGDTPVVLAWYPQAFTSGCTLECKSLVEDGGLIRAFAVPYFMLSVDSIPDNLRFAEAMEADFPLLSDPTKEVARAYGVLHQERFALRTNLYIAADGTVLRIDRNVNPATAARDIAAALDALGFAKRRAAAENSK